MANKAINDLLKYGTRLITLPTYASSSEALAGKNGISMSDGTYYNFVGITNGRLDLNIALNVIFTLTRPAILYKFDFTTENHENWFGPSSGITLYGTNDNTNWTTLSHDYTLTASNHVPYITYNDYNDQAVNNVNAYKYYRVVTGSGGQCGLNLYFREV